MDISVVIPLYNEDESLPELIAWIERVMEANGFSYEIILVDDGSRDGSWAVIEENLLDAVIGLPANLFLSTGIPVAILVFDRSRERGGANESRQDVLFIDASREFEQDKKQNSMTDEQIAHVVETYRNRREVEKYAHVASIEEIRENEFNLNIPRYVDTFEAEKEIDIDAVQTEIDRLETELADVRKKMAELLKGIKR